MAKNNTITQAELCELLDYDPQTGKLFWKPRPAQMFKSGQYSPQQRANVWNAKNAGKEAFTANSLGYKAGAVWKVNYVAHRVIWRMVYGTFPVGIDHINGDRSDNRLSNLREANQTVNGSNQKLRSTNKSGVMGVGWYEVRGNWRVRIGSKTIGYFITKEEAIAARKAAEKAFGYHPNHGRNP